MSVPMRVLIVEDHSLVRTGLRHLVEEALPGAQVREAASLSEARLRLEDIDHVLLDLSLPDGSGLDLLAEIGQRVAVTVLTAFDSPAFRRRARDLGARAFLSKDARPEELRGALLGLLEPPSVRGHERLTPRELEVLRELGAGRSSAQIARQLGMDEKTLYTHRRHLMQKLGLDGTAALLRYATLYWLGQGRSN
ncbi:DNA-binding NarL/FixJ family response regulator [Deinobacterium chartae]|uniref:DNA-binding NarL/FixJ family response regulator n=1 Tax=Deinobacterium chartae TaxID=521158 RepID=A0A841HXD0_9DEIO|nr:DNA-binding NarL/FixJ family response regulator [Deinobacterium chartae]